MHICMKATEKELTALKRDIAEARRKRVLRIADIGRMANVDASQVSRVVRGDFKTISSNVVQICKVLGLELETLAAPADGHDIGSSRLHAGVRRLYEKNPQIADRLATVLETIADLNVAPA